MAVPSRSASRSTHSQQLRTATWHNSKYVVAGPSNLPPCLAERTVKRSGSSQRWRTSAICRRMKLVSSEASKSTRNSTMSTSSKSSGWRRSRSMAGKVSEMKKECSCGALAPSAACTRRRSRTKRRSCAPQSASPGAASRSKSAHSSYHAARRAYASRGGSPSAGRDESALRYSSTSSMGLTACTTGQCATSTARASAVSTMPPPHAMTVCAACEASVSLSSSSSRRRKTGHPSASTVCMILPKRAS
mmetsp:Transcript_11743/g.27131  ORF Transcript_11743/g.27131 Transcript_11743/m.27131 type:complete len:247 (-) Transcript_11743:87-827(-)